MRISDFLAAAPINVTASNVPLGGVAAVMPGSAAYKPVGSVISRALYGAMAAAYPGVTMYYSLTQTNVSVSSTFGAITSLAYSGGVYVATVGGNLMSSTDCITWFPRSAPAGYYTAVAFGGGTFVAVAVNGATATSLNGTAWASGGGLTISNPTGVAYSGGNFVVWSYGVLAVSTSPNGAAWANVVITQCGAGFGAGTYLGYAGIGNTATAFYSTNGGAVWSSTTMPAAAYWGAFTGNGMAMVAVAGFTQASTVAAYSTNGGVNWTPALMPVSALWNSVSWNSAAGLFVAVGSGYVATSPTGAVWTLQNPVQADSYSTSVSANGITIISSSQPRTTYLTTVNGTAFVQRTGYGALWGSASYGNGVYLATTGFGSNVASTSVDGLSWSASALPAAANWVASAFGNGVFVAIADNGTTAASSADAVSWTPQTLPANARWAALTYGTNFVAVAGTLPSNVAAYSANGSAWTQATMPATAAWQSVAFGNGTYVAVAGGPSSASNVAAYSTNGGASWSSSVLPASTNWSSVTYGNGKFVAVALNSNIAATSIDGVNWVSQTLPVSAMWTSVCFGNGFFLAIATTGVAATSVDGLGWSTRALSGPGPWGPLTYGTGLFVALSTVSSSISTVFVDSASSSQYICITGTPGNLVRVS